MRRSARRSLPDRWRRAPAGPRRARAVERRCSKSSPAVLAARRRSMMRSTTSYSCRWAWAARRLAGGGQLAGRRSGDCAAQHMRIEHGERLPQRRRGAIETVAEQHPPDHRKREMHQRDARRTRHIPSRSPFGPGKREVRPTYTQTRYTESRRTRNDTSTENKAPWARRSRVRVSPSRSPFSLTRPHCAADAARCPCTADRRGLS